MILRLLLLTALLPACATAQRADPTEVRQLQLDIQAHGKQIDAMADAGVTRAELADLAEKHGVLKSRTEEIASSKRDGGWQTVALEIAGVVAAIFGLRGLPGGGGGIIGAFVSRRSKPTVTITQSPQPDK